MGVITPTFADKQNGGSPYVASATVTQVVTHVSTAPTVTFTPGVDGKIEPQPLKIAIIGTAPSSRNLAPFGDMSWTIWACSPGNAFGQIPRADAWFEIHNNLLWPENRHYGENYVRWLNEQTFPVYMQDQSMVPRAITFPKDKMVDQFGRYFFTSSFAWMMALAIDRGAAEIALYGVDMASRDEYVMQRSGGHYFIEMARQRGIKITIPYESDLAQPPPLYGFADASPIGRKIAARRMEIKSRMAQMTTERDKLNHNLTYLGGAEEDLDYFQSIWLGVANDADEARYENAKLKEEIAQLKSNGHAAT